jgi:hypothetical protein
MLRTIRLISSPGKHRGMVLDCADMAWVVWPVLNWGLEDHPLVVALTLTLRLDAVGACRTLLSALYATLSTRETAGLCPLAHFAISRCSWEVASGGNVAAGACWRRNLSACHGS